MLSLPESPVLLVGSLCSLRDPPAAEGPGELKASPGPAEAPRLPSHLQLCAAPAPLAEPQVPAACQSSPPDGLRLPAPCSLTVGI